MSESNERIREILGAVAQDGAARAGRSLTGLVGQDIRIHVPNVRLGTRADTCDAVGGDTAMVLGAYLGMSGDLEGHVMLLFPEKRALECVDLMFGRPVGTTTEADEMAKSAVAELGNIVGSAFVNALADHVQLMLHPSPPTVVHDMAIALVQTIYAEILARGNEVVMIDTVFEDRNGQAAGLVIVAPDPHSLPRIEDLAA